ncbi:MAG: pitrilysin family protein [bacterium]
MNFDIKYSKLKNGVRILTVPMASVESVSAMILVKTGSRNETLNQAGISHVLEHMVFKGTKSYPSPMAIAETVDGIGAEQNAFTNKEYTGYYITSAAKHLPLSLKILSEMVTVPLIPQEDLEREREVIVEEINMYEDQPMDKAVEAWENLIYEGSDMGREIIGTKDTVRATTSKTVRAYLDKWYVGGNMLVVIVGKYNAKELADNIEKRFGKIKKGAIVPYVSKINYGPVEHRHIEKKTEQAHFWMGVPAISMTDPRRYALNLASVILGGGMSSRLFNEVREKRGLAYYVGATLNTDFDGGYLGVRAGVKLDKLTEAMDVVRAEMLKLADTITQEELTKAKEFILGHLPLSLEDTMGVAHFVGMRALETEDIRQPSDVEDGIKKATLADVKKVAAEMIRPELIRSVVVGPKAA